MLCFILQYILHYILYFFSLRKVCPLFFFLFAFFRCALTYFEIDSDFFGFSYVCPAINFSFFWFTQFHSSLSCNKFFSFLICSISFCILFCCGFGIFILYPKKCFYTEVVNFFLYIFLYKNFSFYLYTTPLKSLCDIWHCAKNESHLVTFTEEIFNQKTSFFVQREFPAEIYANSFLLTLT